MSLSLINENLLFQSSPLIIKIPTPQKILIIFNPISSAGNTEATAIALAKELMREGKAVEVLPSEKKKPRDIRVLPTRSRRMI
jgi:flavorubredoxin